MTIAAAGLGSCAIEFDGAKDGFGRQHVRTAARLLMFDAEHRRQHGQECPGLSEAALRETAKAIAAEERRCSMN